MKKVAVITRTKDRPLFLARAIQSVANQTYQDYVHVVVNDGGSKEEVESVVNEFDDPVQSRIKLYHRDEASGAPDTIFNESIDRVESEYVAIHDDDDTWHPEYLARTVEVLETGAEGVKVRMDNVYEAIGEGEIKTKKSSPYMPDLQAISLYVQLVENLLTAGGFIYSRKAYKAVGKYDDSLPVAGDWEFGIRFLVKYEVEYLDPGFALANYHRRTNVSDDSYSTHSHRVNITKVLNKYLREDLESGKLGIGYMMNKLRYDRDERNATLKRIIPKSIIKRFK